ncbi:MAG: hypothetical protein JWO22_3373 [Frankiales bacterium]|nr:hypothetical protein [Frankiales bacterium]
MRAVAGAVLGVLLLAGPALADPTPSPTVQEPEAPLVVSVTELLPRAPQAGQAFEVKGAIRNTSTTQSVTGPEVRLARGDVIQSRGELHLAEANHDVDYGNHYAVRHLHTGPTPTSAEIDELKPGQVGYFDIQTDVDSLQLRRTGVYPMDVEARGTIDESGAQLLGDAPTWIPFFAHDSRPRQNKVAVVLPMTDRPHQAPDGSFVDDGLADNFSSGPLAHQLVAAGYEPSCDRGATRNDGVQDPTTTRCEAVPITYAIDPDLASAAYAMATSKTYRVGSGKNARDGSGKRAAQLWLDRLKAQAGGARGSVLVLPYGDPDVDALGASAAGQLDISDSVKLGNQVLTDQVPGTRVDAVLPPSQGSGILTTQAAEALRPQNAQPFAYVLDESAFPDLEDAGRTRSPSAHVTLGPATDPLHGLAVEDTLSTLLLGQSGLQEGDRLAEQRFIAETAIIAAEAPGTSRTFVLSPDRYSDARVGAMAQSLRDLGRLPWLCPVALEPLTQPATEGGGESCANPASPTEARRNVDREDPRTGLRQGTDAQLPASYLSEVAHQGRRATQLTQQVLGTDSAGSGGTAETIDKLQRRLHQAVARAESSAWRQDASGQADQLRRLNGAMTALVQQVNVLTGRVLLTSDKGTIQVAVENKSDLPLQIRLQFQIPGRRDVETALVTVPKKSSVPVGVKVSGLRSGTFPVAVQMRDREDKAFRGFVYVQVRSTRYGRLALGLTFAAAAVLFIAAGTRIARRALGRGKQAPGDPSGSADPTA